MNAPAASMTDPGLGDIQTKLFAARVRCEERGARFTPMRARVLELLLAHTRFVTAYELLDSILETHPRANAATVYRILGFLMANGLVHRLATVNGYVARSGDKGNEYCVFAICGRCGRVSELNANGVKDLLAALVGRVDCALYDEAADQRRVSGLPIGRTDLSPLDGCASNRFHVSGWMMLVWLAWRSTRLRHALTL